MPERKIVRLKDLEGILCADGNYDQPVILFDRNLRADIESGCSAEYACNNYGEREVFLIQVLEHQLLITI